MAWEAQKMIIKIIVCPALCPEVEKVALSDLRVIGGKGEGVCLEIMQKCLAFR
jgi:hypothetical protein